MILKWKTGEQRELPLGSKLVDCIMNGRRPSSVELSAREIQLLARQLSSDLNSVRDNAADYIEHLAKAIFHYE